MKAIQNVFCVGRNYEEHINELANERPSEPVWFMKPSHSIVYAKETERLVFPGEVGAIHYEVELVVQLKEDYVPDQPLGRLIGQVALGLDLTLRELQSDLKAKGMPWLRAKGFRNSAVISDSLPFESLPSFSEIDFSLVKNDEIVQQGLAGEMIYSLEELLQSCWEQFDLKKGDVIFTGTPAGVGAINEGDFFQLFLNNGCLGELVIEINK